MFFCGLLEYAKFVMLNWGILIVEPGAKGLIRQGLGFNYSYFCINLPILKDRPATWAYF